MNAETKIAVEEKSEEVSEQEKPVAVYSVNFAEAVGNFAENRLIRRRKTFVLEKRLEKTVERSLTQKIFNWRNAIPVAAILAIGVLHFAFQISVIRPEVSENRALTEVPAVEVEPVRSVPVEAGSSVPAVVETKNAEKVAPQKSALRVKNRQFEAAPPPAIAPAKPVVRKKDAVESRAARLRRAEKILTGI